MELTRKRLKVLHLTVPKVKFVRLTTAVVKNTDIIAYKQYSFTRTSSYLSL